MPRAGTKEKTPSVAELMADMDRHLLDTGTDPARFPVSRADAPAAQRTRYKQPGQRSGRGVVRPNNDKQVKYILALMEQKDTTNLVLLPGAENVRHMSARGASDLLDRLLACPDKPNFVRPATDPMIDYIKRLMPLHVITDEARAWLVRNTADGVRMSFEHARRSIEMLKAAPMVSTTTIPARGRGPEVTVAVGMYERPDGKIFLVKKAQKKEHLYAMLVEIVDGKRVATYAPGSIHTLTADMRMTIERAEELTLAMGSCIACGRTLTNGKSVTLGIGPICRGYF